MPEVDLKRFVNLGCGHRYHPGWTNFDLVPAGPEVLAADLSRGIPLPDASCAVVYHSAILEHVRRSEALPFVRECRRVLQPGGLVRVATPDLERLCQLYLEKLHQARSAGDSADYDWIMLELLDQSVREQTGGAMLQYLAQDPLPNPAFVFDRIGQEGRELVDLVRRPAGQRRPRRSLAHVLRRLPVWYGRVVTRLLLGSGGRRAYDIGAFRLDGEVHQWLYDEYSLARLLLAAGFEQPLRQTAFTSRLPGWSDFHLDTLPDGSPIKPDCLFMEALAPGGAPP